MERAIVNSTPERRGAFEPLYNLDPCNGRIVEVFYCDEVLATSFDSPNPGWFWWKCEYGCLPRNSAARAICHQLRSVSRRDDGRQKFHTIWEA